VFRAVDETLFQIDARKGFSASPRAAELANDAVYPPEWVTARRQAAATQINALTSVAGYAALGDDALRLLAGLPSNDEAFTRLTRAPLDPSDATNADRVGPNDDPTQYEPGTDRRIFVDSLDGRARNRYFYRSAWIDTAHNLGPLGMATPPVYLPPTALPQAPALVAAAGGDRSVALSINPALDPTIDTYRIYRVETAAAAQDIRLMDNVATVTDTRSPADRTGPFTATDATVVPYQDYFYRVTAVSPDGRESPASTALGARAFDASPPPEPTWERSEWIKLDGAGAEHPFSDAGAGLVPVIAVSVRFASTTVARALFQEVVDATGRAVSGWITPAPDGGDLLVATFIRNLDPTVAHTLRSRALSVGGVEALSAVREVSAP
jgi:hypothetical protein